MTPGEFQLILLKIQIAIVKFFNGIRENLSSFSNSKVNNIPIQTF